eukprot:Nk52_evm39s1360 gene=Nk52_evmTU39s1360
MEGNQEELDILDKKLENAIEQAEETVYDKPRTPKAEAGQEDEAIEEQQVAQEKESNEPTPQTEVQEAPEEDEYVAPVTETENNVSAKAEKSKEMGGEHSDSAPKTISREKPKDAAPVEKKKKIVVKKKPMKEAEESPYEDSIPTPPQMRKKTKVVGSTPLDVVDYITRHEHLACAMNLAHKHLHKLGSHIDMGAIKPLISELDKLMEKTSGANNRLLGELKRFDDIEFLQRGKKDPNYSRTITSEHAGSKAVPHNNDDILMVQTGNHRIPLRVHDLAEANVLVGNLEQIIKDKDTELKEAQLLAQNEKSKWQHKLQKKMNELLLEDTKCEKIKKDFMKTKEDLLAKLRQSESDLAMSKEKNMEQAKVVNAAEFKARKAVQTLREERQRLKHLQYTLETQYPKRGAFLKAGSPTGQIYSENKPMEMKDLEVGNDVDMPHQSYMTQFKVPVNHTQFDFTNIMKKNERLRSDNLHMQGEYKRIRQENTRLANEIIENRSLINQLSAKVDVLQKRKEVSDRKKEKVITHCKNLEAALSKNVQGKIRMEEMEKRLRMDEKFEKIKPIPYNAVKNAPKGKLFKE